MLQVIPLRFFSFSAQERESLSTNLQRRVSADKAEVRSSSTGQRDRMQPSLNLTANSNKVGGSKVLPLNLRGADVGKKNQKNQGKWGNLFCSFDLKTQDRFRGFGHAYRFVFIYYYYYQAYLRRPPRGVACFADPAPPWPPPRLSGSRRRRRRSRSR